MPVKQPSLMRSSSPGATSRFYRQILRNESRGLKDIVRKSLEACLQARVSPKQQKMAVIKMTEDDETKNQKRSNCVQSKRGMEVVD